MNIKTLLKQWSLTDYLLLLSMAFLMLASLLLVYGLQVLNGNWQSIIRQIEFVALGWILFYLMARMDYRSLKVVAWMMYILMAGLLVLVALFGQVEYGAQRWLNVAGISLQPAEICKFFFIVFMARFFTLKGDNVTWRDFIYSFGWMMLPVILIARQPDLGTALVLVSIWITMLFVSAFSKRKFWSLILVVILMMPLGWNFLHDYQKNRIMTFIDPARDPYGAGYNVMQSQIAIGSGGWWGLGLGKGWQSQLKFLPVAYSDFAFAVWAEEFGFIGSIILILLLAFIIWKIWQTTYLAIDRFGFYLSAGIGGMFIFQIFVNIAMNLGLMPVTGVPLIFVSVGGTSILVSMALMGIVQSVYLKSKV